MNKVIDMELKKLFNTITKLELNYSEKLQTRDFLHLYDFQKHFLYKFIRRFTEAVKVKQQHYWNNNKNIESWQKLSELFNSNLNYTTIII